MTRRLWIPFVAAALAVTPVAGQEAVLPVQDLLYERGQRAPYLDNFNTGWLRGTRRFAGESYLGGLGRSEDGTLRDAGGRGHFTADQLAGLLTALGVRPGFKLWGRSLVVPQAAAEAAARVLDDLRKAMPPRLSIELRLTETVAGQARVRLERTVELVPGRLAIVSEVARQAAVVEYEVEIAQAAMISNPIVGEVRTGTMVALRPQLTPSGEWALLETIVRCIDGDRAAQIDTGHPGMGPIDRVPLQISETGRVTLLRPGAETRQRWSDGDRTFELRLLPQWRLPQPVRPGGHDFGVFSMRGELLGFRSVAVPQNTQDEGGSDPERDDPWSGIAELAGDSAQWFDGAPASDDAPDAERYLAVDAAVWSIGAAVMAWFEAHAEGPELEIRCYDVAAGTAWPADDSAPEGARLIGSTRLAQASGTWSAAAVRTEYTVVRDWDAEVAQSARIPDPKCARVASGIAVNLWRSGERIEVECEVSRIVDPGAKTLTMSGPLITPGSNNTSVQSQGQGASVSQSPPMYLPSDVVRVEHPGVVSAEIGFTDRLGDRPAVHRTSATGLLGDGRELLVVVSRSR